MVAVQGVGAEGVGKPRLANSNDAMGQERRFGPTQTMSVLTPITTKSATRLQKGAAKSSP